MESLVPLVILVYCYGRILWIIRTRIESNMGNEDAQKAKFELARNNLIRTLFIVAFCLVICYTGIDIFYLQFHLGFEVDWNGWFYNFSTGIFFLSCTINPFIYLINYKDFQKALVRQFCCRKLEQESNSEITAGTLTITTSNGQVSN